MAYIVDLRSDTVTKPTEAMKHAMTNSALGDDVYGEDPTVNALESKIAAILGKQAALFVPSGTMANLIAIMVHCNKRGSEAFVGNLSHIYKYEQGGAAHVAGVLLSTLTNKPDGTFDLQELESRIRGTDVHEPVTNLVTVENTHNVCGGKAPPRRRRPHDPLTALVAVENTHNVCGGKVLPLKFLDDLSALCKRHNLPIHMDGARLFNACAHLQQEPGRVVRDCDSVSVCFSKGLSAPVGSALVGSYHFIDQARRMRKMLGGGMRQAGVLAAAAIVALDEVVPLLKLDHKRAQILAKVIEGLFLKSFTVDVEGQHSNIVLVRLPPHSALAAEQVVARLAQVCLAETQGDCKTTNDEGVIVKAIYFNSKTLRFTIHREISDEDLWLAIMKITYVFKELDAAAA
ncbi:probable low-specificity L-threonine aldolase 2 isoform X1 [Trichoplusia ni]|uniref:Probable low-specificity L-threonine aldolase 2 isoform X1 n=1 Tax=Trichoplusia ni TaxID=7111 RepID=A0A7E5VAS6_TRINI|nr:probable low-specificity L-threonine aldolase 2 isoform X1 [Trichoplusia ni]